MCDAGVTVESIDYSVVAVHIPSNFCYACFYWVDHIRRSSNKAQLVVQVDGFLQKHLLHWLEALSLLRKLIDAVEMLVQLEDLYVSNFKCSLLLKEIG